MLFSACTLMKYPHSAATPPPTPGAYKVVRVMKFALRQMKSCCAR